MLPERSWRQCRALETKTSVPGSLRFIKRGRDALERSAEILGPDGMDGLMIYYTPQGAIDLVKGLKPVDPADWPADGEQ
jgi:hypothetical protein